MSQQLLKALYYDADSKPITGQDIENLLVEAGLNKGDIVLVHSDVGSFGKLGDIKNRDEFLGVILVAFLNVLGKEGTLVVPTYTYSFCKNQIFDVRESKSSVGIFAEFVRRQDEAVRSEDPIFSHVGIGENADTLLRNMSDDCFGEDSFFDRFYKAGGKIVNFGKFFDITFLHYIENKFKVNYRFNKKFSGTIVREDGSKYYKEVIYYVKYLLEDGRDIIYDMSLLGNELERRGLLKRVPLGGDYILCSEAKDCCKVGLEMLKKDEYAFLIKDPNVLDFNDFPFCIGVIDSPDNNKGLSLSLPFKLRFNKEHFLIEQQYSYETDKCLQRAYKMGSLLSVNLGSGAFGVRKADDVLGWLISVCDEPLSQTSFLEIGCADGYLLYRLKLSGARNVTGCEPGPMAIEGKEKFGLNIINDFYRPGLFTEKFDIIFSYGVLEHINNPSQFLELQKESLDENGKIFVAVPNCESKIRLGDFGILSHEHYTYFTKQSLKNLLIKCGLTDVDAVIGSDQAMLYVWGRKSVHYQQEVNSYLDENFFYTFCGKVRIIQSKLQKKIVQIEAEGKTIGLYGGGFNIIYVLNRGFQPRFFDSDTAVHGKYYPGHKNPIESPRNLLVNKVDELWIMAIDYDTEIINYLQNELKISKDIHIFSFKHFLEYET